jgi:tripartite-type tricarboxylate transporter receptor subunit TctC
MTNLARRQLVTFIGTAFALPALTAQAQGFPSKPLRIVVPFAAGGPVDTITRALAVRMNALLGQPVIVDNKPGAATIIGTDNVAKSPPDGYSMLVVGAGSRTIMPAIATLPYDPAKDLIPVSRVASAPQIFVASTQFAAKGITSLRELVAWAKVNPGKLNVGSVGAGTITSLAGDLFKREAGIEAVDIPFKGGAPAVTAILAGEVDFLSADVSAVIPHIKAKKMVGLAITGPNRVSDIPDVPTIAEAGYPNVIAVNVYCLYLPAKTPREIVTKINQTVVAALNSPELKAQYAKTGVQAESSSPEELEKFLTEQAAKWQPLAKSLGVRLN